MISTWRSGGGRYSSDTRATGTSPGNSTVSLQAGSRHSTLDITIHPNSGIRGVLVRRLRDLLRLGRLGDIRDRPGGEVPVRLRWPGRHVDKFDADLIVLAGSHDLDGAFILLLRHFLRAQAHGPGFDYVNREEVMGITIDQPGGDPLRLALLHLCGPGDEYLSVPFAHFEAAPPRAEVERLGLGQHGRDAAYRKLGGRIERVREQELALGHRSELLQCLGEGGESELPHVVDALVAIEGGYVVRRVPGIPDLSVQRPKLAERRHEYGIRPHCDQGAGALGLARHEDIELLGVPGEEQDCPKSTVEGPAH